MPKRLVALSSSAIASIYFAGLFSTRAAADGVAGAAAVTPTPLAAPAESANTTATTAPSVVVGASASRRGARTTTAATTAPDPASTPTTTSSSTSQTTSAAASTAYKDGTYSGTGTSRFGTVSVSVTTSSGKISNVQITKVTTTYPVSRIASLPNAVVNAQSANVNTVSGATYSSQAFKQAVQQALAQASA
jgi:uncharacterized protein with FMN-binding domain